MSSNQPGALQARDVVVRMKEYHPPLSGRTGMRLDFNENTLSCSPRVAARLRAVGAEGLTVYPEREPVEAIAAQYLGLQKEQVLLTNGVDEAIHLLCETYLQPGDEVLIVVPTFSMYEIYASSTGATVVSIQANPEEDFRFPVEEVLAKLRPQTRLIAFATPNNPTGTVIDRKQIVRILEAAPQSAVLVDEAYFDFHGKTMLDAIGDYPNLFVARTFSKAYGLAGLRVGILAGTNTHMRMVRKVSSPYNVNGVALACLQEALADQQFISDYVAQIKSGRARLQDELHKLQIRFWPSQANFVLLKIGARHREFVQAMREQGILVRDRSSDPGCAGCVRITIGTREQMDRLLPALHQALSVIQWTPALSEAHS